MCLIEIIDYFLQINNRQIEIKLNIRNKYKQKIPISYIVLIVIVQMLITVLTNSLETVLSGKLKFSYITTLFFCVINILQ